MDGIEEDVFIPEEKTGSALHGDRVQIVIESAGRAGDGKNGMGGRRAEGFVLRVLERANKEIVGYYQKNKNFGFVLPDNQKISKDIFIAQGCDMGVVTGPKVVVKMIDFGGGKRKPEGRIKEILGHVNDPGTDILSIVRAYGLPEEFPREVMDELEGIPGELELDRKAVLAGAAIRWDVSYTLEDLASCPDWAGELAGRLDLRSLPTVTIDGEDAKDLDDAVTICKNNKGSYTLGVHIADVTHYVREGSYLDRGITQKHQRISGGSGDSHAASQAVKRHLLSERRDRPSVFELHHGGGQSGKCAGSPNR